MKVPVKVQTSYSSTVDNLILINLGEVDLRFNTSADGLNWEAIDADKPIVRFTLTWYYTVLLL